MDSCRPIVAPWSPRSAPHAARVREVWGPVFSFFMILLLAYDFRVNRVNMSQWALEQVWVGHNAFNAHVAMANNNATTSQGVVAPIDMADWEQMPFLMMIGGECIGLATSHPF